jgi:hypothetical protein
LVAGAGSGVDIYASLYFFTQKQIEDMMLATLKESTRVPAQMICLLHPWQDPVPFRRVWCLFELYIAIIMHFPAEDAVGFYFYSKLRKEEDNVELESTSKRNTSPPLSWSR